MDLTQDIIFPLLQLDSHPNTTIILHSWLTLLHDYINDIEIDTQVTAWLSSSSPPMCTDKPSANWAIDRISHPYLPLSGVYTYTCLPQPVFNSTIYVVDTGIDLQHQQFHHRAIRWGNNFVNNSPNTDENGHGTFVAALVAGNSYGVSRFASLVAVKTLDKNGDGSVSQVIQGLQWAVRNRTKDSVNIVNLSLGGIFSRSLNRAVTEATKTGVLITAAAGNDGIDACSVSPASSSQAITAGATNITDKLSTFSNRGRCVDILAPGEAIQSAWLGSPTAYRNASGTSFASPLVAGVLSHYATLGIINTTSSLRSIKKELTKRGVKNMIDLTANGSSFLEFFSPTPNVLAQINT